MTTFDTDARIPQVKPFSKLEKRLAVGMFCCIGLAVAIGFSGQIALQVQTTFGTLIGDAVGNAMGHILALH